jgi:tetratricopeptide (TPR) repeat protein
VFWIVLVGSQLYLSTTALRNIPLFALVAAPYAVRNFCQSPLLQRKSLKTAAPAAGVAGTLALAAFSLVQVRGLVTNEFYIRESTLNQFGLGIVPNHYPIQAAQFLKGVGEIGPLFNTVSFGSYLIASDFPVFVDPRGEEHMENVFHEYRDILVDPTKYSESAAAHGFRAAVIETDMLPLITYLRGDRDWRLVYADDVAVIFLHAEQSPYVPALDFSDRWFADAVERLGPPVEYVRRTWLTRLVSPEPCKRLAGFCFSIGRYDYARLLYERAQRTYPPLFVEFEPLGYAREAAGDAAGALEAYRQAIARDPRNRALRLRTAGAMIKTGALADALEHVQAMQEMDPQDSDAMATRGVIDLMQNRPREAQQWLEKAIEVRPQDPRYHAHLARAHARQNRFGQAVAEFERAWELDPADFAAVRDCAVVLLNLREREAALKWIERAEALRPGDSQSRELRQAYEAMPKQP